jgi:REP element-mobilizing transposase RayT
MRTERRRHHVPHFEVAGGICHVTWRLHRDQPPLSPEERTIMLDILKRAPEFGCTWHAAVVMEDHVHALFAPGWSRPSSRFVHSWKGASGRLIAVHSGRTSPIWQAEYHQRWITSPKLIAICADYIRDNPQRRWPGIKEYLWMLP